MNRTTKSILALIWVALMVWGINGVWERLTEGHTSVNHGSYVPWGLWVSSYIFFLGLSEGLFIVAALVHVFGVKTLKPVERQALLCAVVSLLMGLTCIWFDMGHMERAWRLLLRPDFSSVMAWMVWAYLVYAVFLIALLWYETRSDLAQCAKTPGVKGSISKALCLGWHCPESADAIELCDKHTQRMMRILGAFALVVAVMATGGVGALLSTLSARPYWHTGLFPIQFLVGDQVVGIGFLLALVAIFKTVPESEESGVFRWLGWLTVILIVADLFLEWTEFSTQLWYGVGPDAELARTVLFGEFWWSFWILHLLLGSLVPIGLLLIRPMRRWAVAIAGLLIAFTFMSVRLNLIVPGQVTPVLQGLADAYQDPRLLFSYVPSLHEWSIVGFVVALGMGLIFVGFRLLPISGIRPATPRG